MASAGAVTLTASNDITIGGALITGKYEKAVVYGNAATPIVVTMPLLNRVTCVIVEQMEAHGTSYGAIITHASAKGIWAAATTYALGDVVKISGGETYYIAIQGSNTNQAPATSASYWTKLKNTGGRGGLNSFLMSETSGATSAARWLVTAFDLER